jgi:hypothetical protein
MNILSLFSAFTLILSLLNPALACEQLSSEQAYQKLSAFVDAMYHEEACWSKNSNPTNIENMSFGYIFRQVQVCPVEVNCIPDDWGQYLECQVYQFTVSCDGAQVTGKLGYANN